MRLRLVLPAAILAFGFILAVPQVHGKPEYSKKEKKGCVTCHVKAGAKDLNDTGKYYAEHKQLPAAK